MSFASTVHFLDSFEALVQKHHDMMKEKGFWDGIMSVPGPVTAPHFGFPQDMGTRVALLHEELSELFSAFRGGKAQEPCDKDIKVIDPQVRIEADPIGHRRLTCAEEELADLILRIADIAGFMRIDLGRAVLAKMAYNAKRPHKHGKTC